jgi:hypothetical protein
MPDVPYSATPRAQSAQPLQCLTQAWHWFSTSHRSSSRYSPSMVLETLDDILLNLMRKEAVAQSSRRDEGPLG